MAESLDRHRGSADPWSTNVATKNFVLEAIWPTGSRDRASKEQDPHGAKRGTRGTKRAVAVSNDL
jgi:hypothetical protein